MTNLKETLLDLQKQINDKSNELDQYIADENIPLNDRWNLFVEVAPLFKDKYHSGWYHAPDGIDWNKHSLYDDFYCERYDTMKVDEMLDMAIDRNVFDNVGMISGEEKFKRYFLVNKVYSFKNDW